MDSGSAGLLDGRYHLGRVLGRGGAATVYEAADVVLGRAVAVKRFRLDSNASSAYRFGIEARLLANLSHPGMVTVYDVCLDGDQPYLVMQLITGTTLRELMHEGPLPAATVATLGARLAEVLAYVHSCDIVHRDLKPSNVLVDASGDCFLADFGLARALSAAHLTASDEFVGTAAYLAPEQVTAAGAGHRADVYSLGLVLLECLTGRTEYTGTTAEAALARLSRRPRVPPSLGSGWRSVLTAMTERDPADRPTAARCAESLGALADGQETRPFAAPAPRVRPVHAGLVVAGLAAAAALVVPMAVAPVSIPGRPAGEAVSVDTVEPAGAADGTAQPDAAAETAETAETVPPADSQAGSQADEPADEPVVEPAPELAPEPAPETVAVDPAPGSPPEHAGEENGRGNGRDRTRGNN